MEKQILKLPSPIDVLEKTLNIGKTESSILFLLWYLDSSNNELIIDQETNLGEQLLFLENKEYGYSVNDIKSFMKLKKATIQIALKKLVTNNYFSRKKHERSYFYVPTEHSYKKFQNNLKLYLEAFINLMNPFIENSNFKFTLKEIKANLGKNGWYFSGWQEVLGNQKFILHKKFQTEKLNKINLNEFKKDNHGKNIVNLISLSNVFDSHLVKVESPISSPAHVESQLFNKLWTFQNQPILT